MLDNINMNALNQSVESFTAPYGIQRLILKLSTKDMTLNAKTVARTSAKEATC